MNTVMAFKPTIAFITVGIDPFEDNTLGLMLSLARFQPINTWVVIDNAASKPYPAGDSVYRLCKRTSYAAALNFGMNLTTAEWLVTMNNDVVVTGAVDDILAGLVPGVYSPVMMPAGTHGFSRPWLDGWVQIIHRQVYEEIGGFDENFHMAGFEDADYCWRADEAGFPYRAIELPYRHKDAHTRYTMPGYAEQRAANIEYLRGKWKE